MNRTRTQRRLAQAAVILLPALLFAAPVWSQGVAADTPSTRPESKVSKVDALTLKQKTTAAVDFYLKIPDIEGESKDEKHKNEIEVLSWSFGASNSPASRAAPRAASGAGTLVITKRVDKASPALMQASAKGQVFRQMTVAVPSVRAGGAHTTVTLENVRIVSVERSPSGDRPTETLSLNFERVR